MFRCARGRPQHDLAAHLIFCAGQRYVAKLKQRQHGIDPDIDGINDRSHGTGVAEVGARKNLVPVLRRDHSHACAHFPGGDEKAIVRLITQQLAVDHRISIQPATELLGGNRLERIPVGDAVTGQHRIDR